MIDLLNLQPPWPLALLLAVFVLALAGTAVLGLLVEPGRRPRPSEALVAAVLGLAGLGFLLLVARFLALPSFLVTLVLVAAAALAVVRRGRDLIPRFAGPETDWAALAIAGLFVLPTLIGGALMGLGEHPAIFLNADTPYRLTHVYQFVEDRGLPPLSLSNLDVRFGYHYGGPAAVAALHLASGLPVHTAFFLSIAVVTCGLAAAAALLAERIRGPLPFALVFGVILVASPTMAWHFGKATVEWTQDPQVFFNHFPDLTVSIGLFLFLVMLLACLGRATGRNAALILVVTLVIAAAKSSYFAAAGLLVFSTALVWAYRRRDPRWLLLPVLCFLAGMTINWAAGLSGSVTVSLEPLFFFAENSKRAVKHGLDLLLFLLPAGLLWWRAGRSGNSFGEGKDHLVILALSLLALFAFLNLVGSYIAGPGGALEPNVNFLEPLKMLPKLLAVAGLVALAALWPQDRPRLRLGIAVFLGLLIALPLAHRTTHAVMPLIWPEAGHEFVDNRAIGEALAAIPVAGSVIVTNDLRYPADDYKRDRRQMQIPALFGHQAYAANTTYERESTAQRREARQNRLAQPTWDPELARIAAEEGWTHLLIHRVAPHPKGIPLTRLFENERYLVYRFD